MDILNIMSGPGRLLIGEEEKKELLDVIETGHLFRFGGEQDPKFKRKVVSFEDEIKKQFNVKYCVAVTGGSMALLTSMAALGIGPGDDVIVPGYTFVATISAIIYSRAVPILAEIDESLTIDPDDIEKKITDRTKAILPVHMLGNPSNMDKILAVAKKHNLFVIEDCAQALGASYKGKRVGTIGNIGAYSLNHMKVISSGDGGAVVTNDYDLYHRAFGFHDQGHLPSRFGEEIGKRAIIGLNLRMNELTGAVALAQVRKLDYILSTLRAKKKKLKEMIKDIPGIKFRKINDEAGECATLLTLLFDDKKTADKFTAKLGTQTLYHSGWHVYNHMEQILNKKLPTRVGCPFKCKEHGKDVEYKQHMLPRTDDILSRAVNISIGVVDKGLGASFGINILSSDSEIEAAAEKIKKVMSEL
jgi:dTDP-4-amino-4,6-dideoxygalactose transaminase